MDSTTQNQPGPNAGWQQPQTGTRPPLVRSRTDRKIAGVAGGLAAYLGVDPLWIRIAFVLISIPGGLGVLLYLLGWVLIPEEGEQAAIGDGLLEHLRRAPTWVAILLFVIYSAVKLVPIYLSEYQLSDKMQEQARYAVVNRYTEEQIRENVFKVVQELEIPAKRESITVSASNAIVKISMEYTVPVDLFFYRTDLHFAPSSENKALF